MIHHWAVLGAGRQEPTPLAIKGVGWLRSPPLAFRVRRLPMDWLYHRWWGLFQEPLAG